MLVREKTFKCYYPSGIWQWFKQSPCCHGKGFAFFSHHWPQFEVRRIPFGLPFAVLDCDSLRKYEKEICVITVLSFCLCLLRILWQKLPEGKCSSAGDVQTLMQPHRHAVIVQMKCLFVGLTIICFGAEPLSCVSFTFLQSYSSGIFQKEGYATYLGKFRDKEMDNLNLQYYNLNLYI